MNSMIPPPKKLETKIPPPVWGLLTAFLMSALAKLLPTLMILPASIAALGIALIILGLGIDIIALAQFFKSGTTPNPLSPDKASSMVISGLYRYSRNPMYLGMLIALCGWGVYLGNIASLFCLPLFVWLINQFQIFPEERILGEKFGADYQQYTMRVRRWI